MSTHLDVGRRGEDLAVKYLKKKGFKVLARNKRTRYGEIDVICRDGEEVVFVEVKARTSSAFGTPEEAVGLDKRRRLSKAALNFLADKGWEHRRARFDVLSVRLDGTKPDIEHIADAFDVEMR